MHFEIRTLRWVLFSAFGLIAFGDDAFACNPLLTINDLYKCAMSLAADKRNVSDLICAVRAAGTKEVTFHCTDSRDSAQPPEAKCDLRCFLVVGADQLIFSFTLKGDSSIEIMEHRQLPLPPGLGAPALPDDGVQFGNGGQIGGELDLAKIPAKVDDVMFDHGPQGPTRADGKTSNACRACHTGIDVDKDNRGATSLVTLADGTTKPSEELGFLGLGQGNSSKIWDDKSEGWAKMITDMKKCCNGAEAKRRLRAMANECGSLDAK